jgi:hypothetical protein
VLSFFADTFAPQGVRESWFAAHPCPACRSQLSPVTAFDETHYLCGGCGACWRAHNGNLRSVDPLGCHGCAAKGKRECLIELQEHFPRFGPAFET